ncbi:DNA-processing protein DprA [Flavobacterium sp. IMCC34518]|uniref:DNA-processing protein DprA n=1 Tax=Flavobacterium sp. IMCC34518 TaxID=3003623 RepID=UPI0024824375|nr:DNA-processing protein DprA [Flavobacterium sp. IMCC34518]
MVMNFDYQDNDLIKKSVLPFREMSAYEALWSNRNISFKKLSDLFAQNPKSLPSSFVDEDKISEFSILLKNKINDNPEIRTNIMINSTLDYPSKLRDAKEPVEVLYYSGNLDYINSPSVAIVGSRKPTNEGLLRTSKLVKLLVEDNFTIVSGLAEGIDTQAHNSAIKNGGKTIAVIGTPLNVFYPKQNRSLQEFIAKEHLLVSQVPFIRYEQQTYLGNKLFFPERNKTMSAITSATIIIEASETSGTLIQARAALHQNRKLFILQSCFENEKITWPKRFEEQGAIRVKTYDDIKNNLL